MRVLEEGLSMSKEFVVNGKRFKAQDTLTSTRKITTGTMQRLLDEQEKRGITVKSWCIWENLERCTRQCKGDPVHGNCPAYSRITPEGTEEKICGGFAHDLPEGGWYSIADFIKKVSNLSWDSFETQWLNRRPSGESLVYGKYYRDEEPFIVFDYKEGDGPNPREASKLLARARSEGNWTRGMGIDFGANFAVGYYMYDRTTDTWYKYYELFWPETEDWPLKERAGRMKDLDPLGWGGKRFIYGDPSAKQLISDLQGYGIHCLQANNDVGGGIDRMKMLFTRRQSNRMPRYRIFSTCTHTRKEYGETYVHPTDRDGKVDRTKVLKRDDHNVDADRYFHNSYQTHGTSHYRIRKLREGRREDA